VPADHLAVRRLAQPQRPLDVTDIDKYHKQIRSIQLGSDLI
jgi:hypothetical protein